MTNAHVIGEQLYLRPLDRSDAPLLQSWFNDPEVTEQLQMRRPVTAEFEEEFLARVGLDEHRVVLGICRREDDALIGTTGLEDIDFVNRQAQYGICIGDKSMWNRGHGLETTRLMLAYGFRHLNLHRIFLHVYETNPRGLRVYERAGFRREGVLRQSRWQGSRFVDTIAMAVLRDEWPPA